MVLISVPFFICGILVYNKFAANIETNTRNATEQLMEQLGNNLDRFSNEVERLTLAPVSNTEVLRVLDNHSMTKRNIVYLATDEQKQIITLYGQAQSAGLNIVAQIPVCGNTRAGSRAAQF